MIVIFQHLRSREKTTTTTTASDEAFIVFRPPSFSTNRASFENVAKKNAYCGGGGGVSAKPSEDRDHSVPQHPKERKKERKKMTDDAPINPPAPVTHILSFASGQYGSDP